MINNRRPACDFGRDGGPNLLTRCGPIITPASLLSTEKNNQFGLTSARVRRGRILTASLCEPRNPGGFGAWAFIAYDADDAEITSQSGCLGRGPHISNN